MDLAAGNFDEFKTPTAEVSDDSIGPRKSGQHAKAGIARFLVSADDLARKDDALYLADEIRSVAGVADRGRRDDLHLTYAHMLQQQSVALQRSERPSLTFGIELAGLAQPGTEPGHYFFVEDR